MPGHDQIRQFSRRLDHDTLYTELRRFAHGLALRQFHFGNSAVIFLRQGKHLARLDIARNDQRGIVGRIPGLVPVQRVGIGHILYVDHPADHRMMIGMFLERRRHQFLVHQRMRIIVGAPAAFFHHHLDLFVEFFLRHLQIVHAVGFQLHRQRQFGFVQLLEIGRVIVGGESVLAPARCRNDPGELARPARLWCP